MAAWFRFKDVHAHDMGVAVTQYPPATVPEERAEFKSVPGRSGQLALLEGQHVYEDIVLSISCYVADLSRRNEIAAWLRGGGDLVLGCDQEHCYHARAVNQIELNKIVRGSTARSFEAVFRCQPFRYEASPEPYRLTRPTTITGEGTLPASPRITVQGTGNVTLTVGDRAIALDGMAGSVTIDCEAMTAYHTGDPAQRVAMTLLDQDWPQLSTGDTPITWTGDVRAVVVRANWRWL